MMVLKLVMASTLFLSAGMMLRFSAPVIADFAVYEVPSIYNGVVSWLRPPYLYLIINCIIITIVASSKMQSRKDGEICLSPRLQPSDAQTRPASSVEAEEYKYAGSYLNAEDDGDVKLERVLDFGAYEDVEPTENRVETQVIDPAAADARRNTTFEDDATSNKENEYIIPESTRNALDRKDSTEKSPISARFGHRKILKAGPEGSKAVLGVSKPKKQDTLESTWKTITEGRSMPLTRHLRKNETWDRTSSPKITMSKAETFTDRTNTRSPLLTPSPGSGKLKKDPSLSQDELNRRVEAFIKKFNEEMRLQRQESLNQYVQMVKRSSC